MSAYLWSIWNTAARLGLAKPTAAELALLILLGAAVLTLRSFRENYLKVWVVGWTAFVASRLAEHCVASKIPAPFDLLAVQALFERAASRLEGIPAGLSSVLIGGREIGKVLVDDPRVETVVHRLVDQRLQHRVVEQIRPVHLGRRILRRAVVMIRHRHVRPLLSRWRRSRSRRRRRSGCRSRSPRRRGRSRTP